MHVNSRERLRSDGSVAKTGLPTQGARAPFLVREQDTTCHNKDSAHQIN